MSNGKSEFYDIDPNHLDVEWVNQPKLYHKAAEAIATARRDYEMAKAHTEVVWAELDASIRRDPGAYGMEKLREDAVKATILVHKAYQKALQAEIDAKHLVGMCEADLNATDSRKFALMKLVDLRLADYFSEPRSKKHNKTTESWREKKAFGSK